MIDRNKKYGISTAEVTYDATGMCFVHSRKARARLCELERSPDRQGGYGDYTGKSRRG